MSRDLTCNETMSVVDETERKDTRRFFQQQGNLSSARVAPITASSVTQHNSRPFLKTIVRGQTPSPLVTGNCAMQQKIVHAHSLNPVAGSLPPVSSSYVARPASKVVTIRPTSSNAHTHPLFKPYEFSQLSGSMAVVYQQLQQQQQLQQLPTPPQPVVSLSVTRARECDDRVPRPPSVNSTNGGIDPRYFNPVSLSRIRPVANRCANAGLPQQTLAATMGASNVSLRFPQQFRNAASTADPPDGPRSGSARLTPVTAAPVATSHSSRYNPVNGYKPASKGPVQNTGTNNMLVPEKQFTGHGAGASSATTCAASTSAGSIVLPIASATTSGSGQSGVLQTNTHPGPSPRPSILRKVRDTTSGSGSAVRRLVLADAPVSRPGSCANSVSSSSPGLMDDSSTTLYLKHSAFGEGRALSATPLSGCDARAASSDLNARSSHSTPLDSVTPTAGGFAKTSGSPHRAAELDTPRKRLRKQQFDSTQAPDKIKMEVSVQIDVDKVDYQREDVPFWELTVPGQSTESSPEKVGRRRGRPRSDGRISVEPTMLSTTSFVDLDTSSSDNPKPKKLRKDQTASDSYEKSASALPCLPVSNEVNSPLASNHAAEGSRKRLQSKLPGKLDLRLKAKNKKSSSTALENAEAEFAAKTLSCIFRQLQRRKTEVQPRAGGTQNEYSGNLVPTGGSNTMRAQTSASFERDDDCSLSTDTSDVSVEFGPVEKGHMSPVAIASSRSSNVRFSDKFPNPGPDGPVYRPRPQLVNGYAIPRSCRLNHFERPECAKAACDKIEMITAAKKKLKNLQRIARLQNASKRLNLKRKMLENSNQPCPSTSSVQCTQVEDFTKITTEGLLSATAKFYEDVSRICSESAVKLAKNVDVVKWRCSDENSTMERLQGSTSFSASQPSTSCTKGFCRQIKESARRQQCGLETACNANENCADFDVVVDILSWIVDEVVFMNDVRNEAYDEESAHKFRKKRRKPLVQTARIFGSQDSENSCSSVNTLTGNLHSQRNVQRHRGKRKCSESSMTPTDTQEEWDEHLEAEINKVEAALQNLGRDKRQEKRNVVDPVASFNAIYERLLALEECEAKNEKDALDLMVAFVQALDKETYDQLNEEIEKEMDPEDDEYAREVKRQKRLLSFSVQVPRAAPTLPKSDFYSSGHSTDFHPSAAVINDLFGVRSSHFKGVSCPKDGRTYTYLDRKGNRVNERLVSNRFREYEFSPDADVEDMRLIYSDVVLRERCEELTDCPLSKLRTDCYKGGMKNTDGEVIDSEVSKRSRESLAASKKKTSRKGCTEMKSLAASAVKQESCRVELCAQNSSGELIGRNSEDFIRTNKMKERADKALKIKDEGDELSVQKVIESDVGLLEVKSKNPAVLIDLTAGECESLSAATVATGCENKDAEQERDVVSLTPDDRAHILKRARNIREQFATLMQTLRINAHLASTAVEIFSEHAYDILQDEIRKAEGERKLFRDAEKGSDFRKSIECGSISRSAVS